MLRQGSSTPSLLSVSERHNPHLFPKTNSVPCSRLKLPRMKTILRNFLFLSLLAAPTQAAAAVLITEVMYDLEGADSGYEWIEVTNTVSVPVSIAGWRLFEQGVNHKLTPVGGATTILQPAQSAIIADKPENILARYPTLALVFDSAFTLSNDGETLMLKNAGGATVDQVTYRSSLGAKGDGASLHLEGEILRPAMSNPGVYPGELVPVVTKEGEEKSNTSSTNPPDAPFAAVAGAPGANKNLGLLPWIVGLLSIIGIGVAGVLLVKAEQEKQETMSVADEFEIIEKP